MDSKCFNTSQASDLDQIPIPPEILWGQLPSFPTAKAHTPQYTKAKSTADEDSPAAWRRARSPTPRSTQMNATSGGSPYQIGAASPLMQSGSPAGSSHKVSVEYPVKEEGSDGNRLRTVSAGSHGSLGVGQADQASRAVSWPQISDPGSCKGCDDVHTTPGQRILPNSDWYGRYNPLCVSRYQGHTQRFRGASGDVIIDPSCTGMSLIAPNHSYSPVAIARGRGMPAQKGQVDIQQGPQQPLYLRVKQGRQPYPQTHYHSQSVSESQSYNLYSNHGAYAPIYTMSSDRVMPRPPITHPQVKYPQSPSNTAYQTPWKGVAPPSGSQGKIFTCQHQGCGKSFKRAEHLNRHRRMHTGERPFACNEPGCDRRFSRTDNLAAHKKIHRKVKTEFSAASPFPSQATDTGITPAADSDLQALSISNANSPVTCNSDNNETPGTTPVPASDPENNPAQNPTSARSDCGASDADTDNTSLTDKSVAQEVSPVSQQQSYGGHPQSPRKMPSVPHDLNSISAQPQPHVHQILRYQKVLPQAQQSMHPTLY